MEGIPNISRVPFFLNNPHQKKSFVSVYVHEHTNYGNRLGPKIEHSMTNGLHEGCVDSRVALARGP